MVLATISICKMVYLTAHVAVANMFGVLWYIHVCIYSDVTKVKWIHWYPENGQTITFKGPNFIKMQLLEQIPYKQLSTTLICNSLQSEDCTKCETYIVGESFTQVFVQEI